MNAATPRFADMPFRLSLTYVVVRTYSPSTGVCCLGVEGALYCGTTRRHVRRPVTARNSE